MTVYLASDHAGFSLKGSLLEYLSQLGYSTEDVGALEHEPNDDYPKYVQLLVERVLVEPYSFGIICAGSGQGEAMAANRTPGIRAAVFYGSLPAHESLDSEGNAPQDGFDVIRLSRQHNNANILSIGSRFVPPAVAHEAAHIFVSTEFVPAERHVRRLSQF